MTTKIHSKLIEVAADFSPSLVEAITKNGPIHLKRQQDMPFADLLCRAIAGQQLSVKAAKTIWGRVVESAEDRPILSHVKSSETEQLRDCGLSASKCKAMKAIADASAEGFLDARHLEEMSAEERHARLISIWGVGPWTADMMNISYFGEPNIWPEGDVTVKNTLERLTSKRRKTARTASKFSPYRTYLAMHMWRFADAPPT